MSNAGPSLINYIPRDYPSTPKSKYAIALIKASFNRKGGDENTMVFYEANFAKNPEKVAVFLPKLIKELKIILQKCSLNSTEPSKPRDNYLMQLQIATVWHDFLNYGLPYLKDVAQSKNDIIAELYAYVPQSVTFLADRVLKKTDVDKAYDDYLICLHFVSMSNSIFECFIQLMQGELIQIAIDVDDKNNQYRVTTIYYLFSMFRLGLLLFKSNQPMIEKIHSFFEKINIALDEVRNEFANAGNSASALACFKIITTLRGEGVNYQNDSDDKLILHLFGAMHEFYLNSWKNSKGSSDSENVLDVPKVVRLTSLIEQLAKDSTVDKVASLQHLASNFMGVLDNYVSIKSKSFADVKLILDLLSQAVNFFDAYETSSVSVVLLRSLLCRLRDEAKQSLDELNMSSQVVEVESKLFQLSIEAERAEVKDKQDEIMVLRAKLNELQVQAQQDHEKIRVLQAQASQDHKLILDLTNKQIITEELIESREKIVALRQFIADAVNRDKDELSQHLNVIQARQQAEVESLHKVRECRLAKARGQHEAELAGLKTKHNKNLKNLAKRSKRDQRRLKAEHDQQTCLLTEELSAEEEAFKRKLLAETQKQQEEAVHQLDKLREQYKNHVAAMKSAYEQELISIKQRFEIDRQRSQQEINVEHLGQVQELRTQFLQERNLLVCSLEQARQSEMQAYDLHAQWLYRLEGALQNAAIAYRTVPIKILSHLQPLMIAGMKFYFVGGIVRKLLFNMPISESDDYDVMVDATTTEVESILGGQYHRTSSQPKLIKMDNIDLWCERWTGVSSAEELQQDPLLDIKRALIKRDFTINTFVWDESGTIFDMLGVRSDLYAAELKLIGDLERLTVDFSLALRWIRFAVQMRKIIPAEAIGYIKDHTDDIRTIPLGVYVKNIHDLFITLPGSISLQMLLKWQLLNVLPCMPKDYEKYLNNHFPRLLTFWEYKLSELSQYNIRDKKAFVLALFLMLPILVNSFAEPNINQNILFVLSRMQQLFSVPKNAISFEQAQKMFQNIKSFQSELLDEYQSFCAQRTEEVALNQRYPLYLYHAQRQMRPMAGSNTIASTRYTQSTSLRRE